MIYLDTSLLVKLYVPEPDSPAIVDAIHADSQIVLSDLAQVEVASAVARLVREGLLGKARGRDLLLEGLVERLVVGGRRRGRGHG